MKLELRTLLESVLELYIGAVQAFVHFGAEVIKSSACARQSRSEAMAETSDDFEDLAGRVSGDAYQVIGALADAAGLFDHPEVIRALDYFGYEEWRKPGVEILPFGAALPSSPRSG